MENESVNNSDQDQGGANARLMDDLDISKCKGCHVSYKSLLKHLVKKEACHQAYSDQEMNHLKDAVKLACDAKESKRKKMNYQQDKQEILEKRKLHYQKNKISISEKRSDYYHQNSDKIVEMRAEYYLKNKEAILEKTKQRQHDKKVQEQKAKAEAEAVKGGHKRDKKEAEEHKEKSPLEEAIKVRLESISSNEMTARNINRVEGEFLKDTRQKQILKLKLNPLSEGEKQKLINLEKVIANKYKSFEEEIDVIMIDVKGFMKETFESMEDMYKKTKIIDRKFHELYKAIYSKDEPESPDRILKEWKEVQNEVDIVLIALSLKLNVPVPYSPKCWSNCKRPCDLHIYPDPDELRNEWTKYIEDTEENSVIRSKIIRNYTSVLFNIYNKKNPLEF